MNKLVAVFHIDGKIPYATLGFIGTNSGQEDSAAHCFYKGLYGALTGMSSAGLTVHEAGNDVTAETFKGFTWVYRLRYKIQHATTFSFSLDM